MKIILGKVRPLSRRPTEAHPQVSIIAPVWQLGVTTRDDLPGSAVDQLTRNEFESQVSQADVVITHSGVGTLMEILDMGVFPVVVPRLARRGEHVDDHQLQAAGILRDLGIAAVTDAEDLSRDTIMRAAAHTIAKQGAC